MNDNGDENTGPQSDNNVVDSQGNPSSLSKTNDAMSQKEDSSFLIIIIIVISAVVCLLVVALCFVIRRSRRDEKVAHNLEQYELSRMASERSLPHMDSARDISNRPQESEYANLQLAHKNEYGNGNLTGGQYAGANMAGSIASAGGSDYVSLPSSHGGDTFSASSNTPNYDIVPPGGTASDTVVVGSEYSARL